MKQKMKLPPQVRHAFSIVVVVVVVVVVIFKFKVHMEPLMTDRS